MSAVIPACCHTHLLKSEHQVSFSFSTPKPSESAENPATSVLYGSQSTPLKFVTAGVSSTPTWLSAMAAICWLRPAVLVAAAPWPVVVVLAVLAAARAAAGKAARVRCADARCAVAGVLQAAGSARCHADLRLAGRPSAHADTP